MKNYTKVPAPKGLPAWPAAMLGLSAERPRGVSRAGGRVSLACAAVGAIDRESERGEESARLLTQSWTRTVVDARRTRDIDLLVSRVSSQLYMPAAFTPHAVTRRSTDALSERRQEESQLRSGQLCFHFIHRERRDTDFECALMLYVL